MSLASTYLDDVVKRFADQKAMADKAVAQVADDALTRPLDGDSNSIAILMRHMAGNMRSRWTDFLTTDGEKPTRMRDREFELPADASRAAILADWESGWTQLFAGIGQLSESDLDRTVSVRFEQLPVVSAINRQLAHHAYHVGQIVQLARHSAKAWETLSIPRGRSEEFNEKARQAAGQGKRG
jgi:hypothetical protein